MEILINKRTFFVFFVLAFFCVAGETHAATLGKPANNLGLLGYWNFNEGSGNRTIDSSGKGKIGVFVGSPAWVTGKFGGALDFNGTTDYVSVSGIPASTFTNKSFTWSAWVKGTELGSPLNMPFIGSGSSSWFRLGFRRTGSSFVFSQYLDGSNNNDTNCGAVDATQWVHLVVVAEYGGNVTCYRNGIPETPKPYVDDVTAGVGFGIGFALGSHAPWNNYFDGSIDEVRVYTRALSTAEVQALYTTGAARVGVLSTTVTDGLIHRWTMDGPDVTDAIYDRVGGNNSYIINAATSTAKIAGKVGQALQFDGVNDYTRSAQNVDVGGKTATFSLWAYYPATTTIGSNATAITAELSTNFNSNDAFYLGFNDSSGAGGGSVPAGSFKVSMHSAAGYSIFYTNANYSGAWHLVTVVFDRNQPTAATQITLYVDGALASVTQQGGFNAVHTTSFGAYPLFLAARGGYFASKATFDDVRVYNRALSAAEVKQIYTETAGSKVNTDTANLGSTLSSGLVGYWSFNGTDVTDKVYDRSGVGNNGYFIGSATSSAKTIGKVGQALKFDGSSSRVLFTAPSIANASFSFTGWVYQESTAVDKTWFSIGSSGTLNNSVLLRVKSAGGMRFGFFANDLDTADGVFTRGAWHFVACTYNVTSGERVIYLDGVQVARNASGVAAFTGDTAASIGQWVMNGGERWPGKIDEVRLYNRALSSSEVKQLYLAGK